MIEREKEFREVTEVKERVVASIRKCDVCGKIIFDSRQEYEQGDRTDYWSLTTGHHDWVDDFCGRLDTFDICSPECLQKKFDEYIKDSNGRDNTCYFKVQHERYGGG